MLYQNKEKVVDSNIVPLVLTVEHLFLASTRPPGELSEDDIKQYNSLLKTEKNSFLRDTTVFLRKLRLCVKDSRKLSLLVLQVES